ncbi:unnamed protein product, partial [Polarella glacialis]
MAAVEIDSDSDCELVPARPSAAAHVAADVSSSSFSFATSQDGPNREAVLRSLYQPLLPTKDWSPQTTDSSLHQLQREPFSVPKLEPAAVPPGGGSGGAASG